MKAFLKKAACALLCAALLCSSAACGKGGEKEDAEEALGMLHRGYRECGKKHGVPDGDVLLLQVNSLALYALREDVMPSLCAFAEGAYSCGSFYAQQGDDEGIYSALSSLYSPLGGADTGAEYFTLAHLLKENGYAVSAYCAEKDAALLTALGFEKPLCGVDTKEALAAASALADNGEKDFVFLTVDALSYPYIAEGEGAAAVNSVGPLTGYLTCAAYADTVMKDFLEGVPEETTVVIYGTAPRLDEKFPVYAADKELFPNGFSYDEAYKTPLIIRGAKGRAVTEGADFATVYDIYPTLAAYLGVKDGRMLVSGENVICGVGDGERFFALQGEYARGYFITDSVYYLKPNKIPTIYNKETMEQLFDDYSGFEANVLKTVNECEQAVKSGYFGGKVGYEQLYADMPPAEDMTLYVEGEAAAGVNPASFKAYLASGARTFGASTLCGTAEGVTLADGALTLEDGVEGGSLVTGVMKLDEFEKLYISPAATGGGSLAVYASYEGENGVYAPWRLVFETGSEGTRGDGVLEAEGKAEKARLKVVFGRVDGKAPVLHSVTAAPYAEGAEAELPHPEDGRLEAIEVFAPEEYGTKVYSGVLAVNALVAASLGEEPDIEGAAALCCDGEGSTACTTSPAALANYAASKGLTAYVDVFSAAELVNALSAPQQVICKTESGFILAVGYDGEGIIALLPENGEQIKIPYKDINKQEVIIVDSNLYKPEIIEAILPENSSIRPGAKVDKKKYIVIHNTGNYGSTATAKAHSDYLLSQTDTPDRQASWHYTVDDREIYHHLPNDENAWHASDGSYGEGNFYGIGIEICVNNFPGVYEGEEYEAFLQQFMRATKNAAYLVAKLMIENDIGMDGIKQHYDFAPDKKNCPMQMRYTSATRSFTRDEGDMWLYLLGEVEKQYNSMKGEQK